MSHLLMESIPSNVRTSHSIYCRQKTSSSATEGTPRSVGTGCQCFPQCGLHEGPHFPSKQDKKFKEVMMLPWSLADTRRQGIACLLSCTTPSTSLLSIPCSLCFLSSVASIFNNIMFKGMNHLRRCTLPTYDFG